MSDDDRLRPVITTPRHPFMIKTRYQDILPYTTRDGSVIRELVHPQQHGNVQQSLAEASLAPGMSTLLHRHRQTEEIYHITAGHGMMTLGDACFAISPGDSICIPPGTAHALENTGDVPLKLLCCCAPAYRHDDTELL